MKGDINESLNFHTLRLNYPKGVFKMKMLKKGVACVATAILVVLAVVPFGTSAVQSLNSDGTITVTDPDNRSKTITITDPNGDGKISIADSTAILQFLGGYNYNTADQSERMDVTKNGVVSEADSYFIICLYVAGVLN